MMVGERWQGDRRKRHAGEREERERERDEGHGENCVIRE